MATPLWFTSKHDIGAYTRFGFGWGPIEVIRDERRENGVRVVKVRINGETINTIEVDDRGSIVRTHTEDSADVMTSAPKTGCAADVMTDKLRGLVEVFKTDLTDKRREKKYVTRAMIDAIDELTDIVDQL